MIRKIFLTIWFMFCCFFSGISTLYAADVCEVESEGVYILDENSGEGFNKAKENAHNEALRNAIQEAAMYISAKSVAKDSALDKDTIEALACGLVQIQEEKIDTKVVDKHTMQFTCKLKATVTTDDNELKIRVQDKKKLQESREQYNKLIQGTQAVRDANMELRKKYLRAEDMKNEQENEKERRKETIKKLNHAIPGLVSDYIDLTSETDDIDWYLDVSDISVYNYPDSGCGDVYIWLINDYTKKEPSRECPYVMTRYCYRITTNDIKAWKIYYANFNKEMKRISDENVSSKNIIIDCQKGNKLFDIIKRVLQVINEQNIKIVNMYGNARHLGD